MSEFSTGEYATGEYATMVWWTSRLSVRHYPRSHVVRVAAREYMEGFDPSSWSAWAKERSVSVEDRRLISEMLDRDGLRSADLLPEIETYIVNAAIAQCDAD